VSRWLFVVLDRIEIDVPVDSSGIRVVLEDAPG
jgi:hypothetical protein